MMADFLVNLWLETHGRISDFKRWKKKHEVDWRCFNRLVLFFSSPIAFLRFTQTLEHTTWNTKTTNSTLLYCCLWLCIIDGGDSGADYMSASKFEKAALSSSLSFRFSVSSSSCDSSAVFTFRVSRFGRSIMAFSVKIGDFLSTSDFLP